MRLTRRTALAAIASGLGGCTAPSNAGETTDRRSAENRATTEETTRATTSAFDVAGCAGLTGPRPDRAPDGTFPDGEAETVVRPAGGDSPVPLTCSLVTTPGDLPTTEFQFRVTNESDRPFDLNPYGWRLQCWRRGAWFDAAPRAVPVAGKRLAPDESITWSVSITNAPGSYRLGDLATTEPRISGLGPGSYAFTGRGFFRGDDPQGPIRYGARLELVGQPLRIDPDAVRVRKRTSDRLVLQGNSDRRSRTYTLERSSETASASPVILEQIIRSPTVRTLLAVAAGCQRDTVTIEDAEPVGMPYSELLVHRSIDFQGATVWLSEE